MKNIKHITILENDQLHENNKLDYCLSKIKNQYEKIGVKVDVWDWFGQDVSQNKEQSIKRLKELSEEREHVFLVYTNFVGYDNTFDGWLYYLNQLSELGIKLKIYLIFGSSYDNESLLDYCLHYWFNQLGYSKCKENRLLLEKGLKNHEIYSSYYDDLYVKFDNEVDILNKFKSLKWIDIENLIFKKGEVVRIKETGDLKEIIYVFFHKSFDSHHVDVIMDNDLHLSNETAIRGEYRKDAYKTFKLDEIEKYRGDEENI